MADPRDFFNETEQGEILDAIAEAESITSGEIRVHVDLYGGEIMARAQEVFDDLGMSETKQRNGVLLYLAVEEGRFVVLGDTGIAEKVPENFWDHIRDGVQESFRENDFLDGVLYFIEETGEHLQEYFPHESDDVNELPDAISFGKAEEGIGERLEDAKGGDLGDFFDDDDVPGDLSVADEFAPGQLELKVELDEKY